MSDDVVYLLGWIGFAIRVVVDRVLLNIMEGRR